MMDKSLKIVLGLGAAALTASLLLMVAAPFLMHWASQS